MRDARHYPAPVPVSPDELATVAPRLFDNALLCDWRAETAGDPTYAVANHGRWVASCPVCNSAQLTAPEDPRFLCVDCGNLDNGGRYRPVIWPKQHEVIGRLLDARPDVELRNWSPPEKVADLRAENRLIGAPA